MIESRLLLLTLVSLAAVGTTTPARAADPGCGSYAKEDCGVGQSTDRGFGVELTSDSDPASPSRPRNAPQSPTYIDRNFVPTCTGNSAFDGGTLCNASVMTCPVESEVRFWVFETTILRATGQPVPGTGARLVDTVCLGPDAPVLDPAVAIPALVQREFKSVVVLSGHVEISPKPDTLVNIATRFQTDAPAAYDIPLTLLNQSVVIRATAERYIWTFGDGTTAVSTQPKGFLEHTYTRAGTREAYVDIEWSGTFSINGGPPQPIAGRALSEGDPVDVRVREARSELVRE